MYDAIVVGSRCAGAPTAMLLARRGRRVLRRRSGLARRATSCPATPSSRPGSPAWPAGACSIGSGPPASRSCRHVRFDFGPSSSRARRRPSTASTTAVCIRRTVLDPLLADAAAEAGAEVRHGFTVKELVCDGDRVVGIRGHDGAGRPVEERAPIVVGADGANCFVARSVARRAYHVRPATTFAVYCYWRGRRSRPARALRPARAGSSSPLPTNDGLTLVAQQVPCRRRRPATGDRTAAAFAETLAEVPRLAARVAAGERVERFRLRPPPRQLLPSAGGPGLGPRRRRRLPQGPDHRSGDARRLPRRRAPRRGRRRRARRRPRRRLRRYQQARDAAALPMYEFTCGLADLEQPPSAEMQGLLAALEGKPAHDRTVPRPHRRLGPDRRVLQPAEPRPSAEPAPPPDLAHPTKHTQPNEQTCPPTPAGAWRWPSPSVPCTRSAPRPKQSAAQAPSFLLSGGDRWITHDRRLPRRSRLHGGPTGARRTLTGDLAANIHPGTTAHMPIPGECETATAFVFIGDGERGTNTLAQQRRRGVRALFVKTFPTAS